MGRGLRAALLALLAAQPVGAEMPPPESFLGHPVGADRRLAAWPRVLDYLRLLDSRSSRISIESAGQSTGGNEMPVLVLTSETNQHDLERYREIARRLAWPSGLSPEAADELVALGKVIALVTCTIHSTEVGCTQMALEFAHRFATTEEPEHLAWMDDVILLLMPSINPDGQLLVVDWYERYLGTPYEGGPMPWLYHPYVGHDNNRDFYMLTQAETRAVNDLLYHRWFPQVFVDEHQMGSTGPRMFVPPQTDPLDPEVHPLIFRQADLIGTVMAFRLEEAGRTGVGHNMIYDSYWPGGTRNTAWWKNVTGLLTEVASARIASPVFVDPGELEGGRKGFPEPTRRSNYPSPWRGGWWRLRDIVDYELVATWALLESCSRYRDDLLRNSYRMAHEAIERGASEPPYAWLIPPDQHDPVASGLLVELLLRHGIEVREAAEALRAGRTSYPLGTVVIPASQPYRAFLLTMLRPQRYPEVLPYSDGPVIPPYDITSWSLPLAMGVEVVETERPLAGRSTPIDRPRWPDSTVAPAPGGFLLSHAADSVFTAINRLLAAGKEVVWLGGGEEDRAPGEVYLAPEVIDAGALAELAGELHLPVRSLAEKPSGPAFRLRRIRVGLYKPWVASSDEGWTRWLLERYEFPFVNLDNEQIQKGDFRDLIDLLLLPDVEKSILATGEPAEPKHRPELPPPYAGGLGPEGGEAIRTWVENGGAVVALDSAADYLIEILELPVENVLALVPEGSFSSPGSMLRIRVDTSHPLGFGMRREEAAFVADSPAFRTFLPEGRFERRVVARYPDDEDDLLLSGYLVGGALLERRAAVVDLAVGDGRVVLIGFGAQHRAQPHRSFKLLFNALYLPGLEEFELEPPSDG